MEQISETIKKILKTIIYFIMNLFLTFISPLWSTIKQAAALVVPKILCWDRLITAARCRYGTQNGDCISFGDDESSDKMATDTTDSHGRRDMIYHVPSNYLTGTFTFTGLRIKPSVMFFDVETVFSRI